jgi:hypothetical protein
VTDQEPPEGSWNPYEQTRPAAPAYEPPPWIVSQPPEQGGTPPWIVSQPPEQGGTPPWIVSQPADQGGMPARPAGRRGLLVALILGGAVAVLLVAGLAVFAVRRFDAGPAAKAPGGTQTTDGSGGGVGPPATDPPTAEAPSTEPATTEPATTEAATTGATTTEATTGPEQEALAQLENLSRQGLTQVSLTGQFAAQLASKNPGIADRFQAAADGSHTFRATDILREFKTLHDDPRNGDATVVLLKSTDYGKRQLYNGRPLYVTFALRDFASRQDVLAWCARRFPELSGEALADQCAARRLMPGS